MKANLTLFLLGAVLAAPLSAQVAPPVTVQYAPGALEQLVAPIALYPDALVALILPAAAASTDVALAARYLEQNGDPAQADAQPWHPSVQALAHYPDLISWMNANLAWTQALGQAYATQPAAVMQAIQTVRAQALAAGNLQSTPEQQVVVQDGIIEIVPTQPAVIYVPSYDSTLIFERVPVFGRPLVSFHLAFRIGPWLHFDCDWRHRSIRQRAWDHDRNRPREFRSPAVVRAAPPPFSRRDRDADRREVNVRRNPPRVPHAVPVTPPRPPRGIVATKPPARRPSVEVRQRNDPRPAVHREERRPSPPPAVAPRARPPEHRPAAVVAPPRNREPDRRPAAAPAPRPAKAQAASHRAEPEKDRPDRTRRPGEAAAR